MSPYSMLLLTNQAMYTGQTQVLQQKEPAKEKKTKHNRVKTRSHVAASAPSFFPMGPEEEVFDIELEDGLSSSTVFKTPTTNGSYKSRGNRTPSNCGNVGAKNRRPSKTPGGESKSCGRQGRQLQQTPNNSTNKHNRRDSETKKQRKSFRCEEVLEYAVDTYRWKRQLERRYSAVKTRDLDTDVTGEMRHTLLQWLAIVARQFGFSCETWCLCVNYLDRFTAVQALDKECLQLVGLTALLIAAKLEEQNPPQIMELVELCASSYTRKNFKHMEVIMLMKMEYKLLAPTPSFQLAHIIQVKGEKDWCKDLSRHMIEMCLCHEKISTYPPTDIAHSIYTIIKSSDPLSVSEVTQFCPICRPAYGDPFTREFIICCFEEITKHIQMTARSNSTSSEHDRSSSSLYSNH